MVSLDTSFDGLDQEAPTSMPNVCSGPDRVKDFYRNSYGDVFPEPAPEDPNLSEQEASELFNELNTLIQGEIDRLRTSEHLDNSQAYQNALSSYAVRDFARSILQRFPELSGSDVEDYGYPYGSSRSALYDLVFAILPDECQGCDADDGNDGPEDDGEEGGSLVRVTS